MPLAAFGCHMTYSHVYVQLYTCTDVRSVQMYVCVHVHTQTCTHKHRK